MMTKLTLTGPVRTAFALTSGAAVIALLGVGSAWALTPSASAPGTCTLAASSPAAKLVRVADQNPSEMGAAKASEDAYPAKYDKAREKMQQGAMLVQEGIADEQKGAAEVRRGMELEQEGAELLNPHP